MLLAREIASRLDAKCDKLADAVVIDDIGQSIYFIFTLSILIVFDGIIGCLACLICAWICMRQQLVDALVTCHPLVVFTLDLQLDVRLFFYFQYMTQFLDNLYSSYM